MSQPQESRNVGANASPWELSELINSSWKSQAIYVAARLGIADLLSAGPKTSEELAKATATHRKSLHRLMGALTTLGLVKETPGVRFELQPLGEFLRSGVPGSLRSWAIHWGSSLWAPWGELLYSVKTGKSAREHLGGSPTFDDFARNPEVAATFNQAMVEFTSLTAPDVAKAYDFTEIRTLADVGGGYGQLLATILSAYPKMRGILFDLPHSIEGAKKHLGAAGVAERCALVAGSFFETVPPGADAYFLKGIIHDWPDDRATVILKNCRRAMGGRGKLLLGEQIMPERLEASPEHQGLAFADLNMMVALASQERTEKEFHTLLDAAGFRLTRVIPAGFMNVIEAVCA